jgi:hypothetical protein
MGQHVAAGMAERAGDSAYNAFMALGGASDDELNAWLETFVPQMRGVHDAAALQAQAQAARMTDELGLASGQADVAKVLANMRSGVTVEEAYARPVITMRNALFEGHSWDEAREMGARDARGLAMTDVGVVYRSTVVDAFANTKGVAGYRRVPAYKACPFCLLIATNTYNVGDLAPAHPHCGCGIAPVTWIHDDEIASVKLPPGSELDYPPLDYYDLTGKLAYRRALTPAEGTALHAYQGGTYNTINRTLRKPRANASPQAIQVTDDDAPLIDRAIDKYRLPRQATVYRGMGEGAHVNRLNTVGQRFRDDGFVSTTRSSEIADEGFGGTLAEIRLPEGFPAAPFELLGSGELTETEQELLLPRGLWWQIVDVPGPGHIVLKPEWKP